MVYYILKIMGCFEKGEIVIVYVVVGGVGILVVQFVKIFGVGKVIVIVSFKEKFEFVKNFGVDEVINYIEIGWEK